MARAKLTDSQRKVVPNRIFQLICAGFNQGQVVKMIAEEFGVEMSQQNVSRYFLKMVRKEDEKTEVARKKALARYEWGMKEAADAWQRSKKKVKHSVTEKSVEGAGRGESVSESSEKTEEIFDDPRYLAEYRQFSELHDRITGVRAPEKREHEITGLGVMILEDNERLNGQLGEKGKRT